MTTIAGQVIEQQKQWSARWCWSGTVIHPWNQYVLFRREVEIAGTPARALARVSADALYTLYVNGHRVHQGPARCYPGRQSYDTLDLTPLFRSGKNVISAIVHQFGVPTFQHVFRDANGFLVDGTIECDGSAVPFHTPDGWLCRVAEGWRKNVARQTMQLGFQEHFDADADPVDWMSPSFEAREEDGWKSPWAMGPVGTHPWLLMEPRGVPLLADHVESIAAVVAQFRGENPRGYKVVEDVYHLVDPAGCKKDNTALENPSAMLRDDDDATIVPVPPEGQFIAVTLDLGTYRTGHIVLDIAEAAGDEFVDVLFCEEIEKSQLPLLVPIAEANCNEAQAIRYRCRPGAQRWESFHYIGMRYLLVVFRNVENQPLKIRRIAVRQVHTAFEQSGSFSCSDDRLNRIWEVGRHTQLNCSFDAFVDCPWREMAMWWGDSRVQGQVTLYSFGDTSLLERGIRLIAQSQTPDGSLHAHAPADVPRHRLPDFMMTWVGTLWDHYQYTGRTDLLRECLPTMHRVFEFLAAHESVDHLIGNFDGYWMFLDWAPVFKGNYSAAFNLLYLQSLRWAAELCRLAEEVPNALVYESASKRVEAAIEVFWDAKAGCWRDGFDRATGKQVEQISQHTNTLAILLGLKPQTHATIASEILLKSSRAKRTKIITASPFFYAYVLQAMASQGLQAEVIKTIRDKWGSHFLDLNASTFYEMWTVTTQSRCHAWSASPVYHLMQILLGITPTSPGWKAVRISPFAQTLDFARGVVPTPRGLLRVEWEKAGEDQLAVRVDVPEGMSAEFVSPTGQKRELVPGANEFHT
jgi:hypothetical protein